MKTKQVQEQNRSSSFFKNILWIVVVFMALNIKLYMNRISLAHFEIRGNDIVMENNGLNFSFSKSLDNQIKCINYITEFREFYVSLEKLKNLNELYLFLGNNPIINEQEKANTLSEALSKLTILETLNLGLDSLFNNENRETIIKRLSKISGLNTLYIFLIIVIYLEMD